jgi:lipoprotein signal peptidase
VSRKLSIFIPILVVGLALDQASKLLVMAKLPL